MFIITMGDIERWFTVFCLGGEWGRILRAVLSQQLLFSGCYNMFLLRKIMDVLKYCLLLFVCCVDDSWVETQFLYSLSDFRVCRMKKSANIFKNMSIKRLIYFPNSKLQMHILAF